MIPTGGRIAAERPDASRLEHSACLWAGRLWTPDTRSRHTFRFLFDVHTSDRMIGLQIGGV